MTVTLARNEGNLMKAAQIVLIEDSSADVLLIELALRAKGIAYEMTRFKTGLDAVAALCAPDWTPAAAPRPDAILMDLNTPKSDGFEVLGKLRGSPHLADVPIAIITSSQARSDKHRSSLLGAERYIEKPSQLDEFLTTVGRAVEEMLRPREP